MSKAQSEVNHLATKRESILPTVQAGTPMTVTGNGASFPDWERGVFIFCLEVSRGPGQSPGVCTQAGARR